MYNKTYKYISFKILFKKKVTNQGQFNHALISNATILFISLFLSNFSLYTMETDPSKIKEIMKWVAFQNIPDITTIQVDQDDINNHKNHTSETLHITKKDCNACKKCILALKHLLHERTCPVCNNVELDGNNQKIYSGAIKHFITAAKGSGKIDHKPETYEPILKSFLSKIPTESKLYDYIYNQFQKNSFDINKIEAHSQHFLQSLERTESTCSLCVLCKKELEKIKCWQCPACCNYGNNPNTMFSSLMETVKHLKICEEKKVELYPIYNSINNSTLSYAIHLFKETFDTDKAATEKKRKMPSEDNESFV